MTRARAATDLSLWSIVERLQRRLERQGMPDASADRAIAAAVDVIVRRPAA
jgi:hypothetical protein